MNASREVAILDLIDRLHARRKSFLNEEKCNSFECNSVMLGSMTKQMSNSGLLDAGPPFNDLCYGESIEFCEIISITRMVR